MKKSYILVKSSNSTVFQLRFFHATLFNFSPSSFHKKYVQSVNRSGTDHKVFSDRMNTEIFLTSFDIKLMILPTVTSFRALLLNLKA